MSVDQLNDALTGSAVAIGVLVDLLIALVYIAITLYLKVRRYDRRYWEFVEKSQHFDQRLLQARREQKATAKELRLARTALEIIDKAGISSIDRCLTEEVVGDIALFYSIGGDRNGPAAINHSGVNSGGA